MNTSDLFAKEVNYIKNEHIKNMVIQTLNAAPEWLQVIPASSSGKYHPEYGLGEGGLVRHIKAAVDIAHSLTRTGILNTLPYNLQNIDVNYYEDVIYAALILHDCCKADDTPQHQTIFEHPVIAANLFLKIATDYLNDNPDFENIEIVKRCIFRISDAISCHMGQWNTSKYNDKVLPTPHDGISWFVHLCDYLASRKFLNFDFEKYYELEG